MLDGLVGDGELAQVATNKVRLDLNIDELLSVVDTDDGADHLWEDDSVSEVGLDGDWLLTISNILLSLGQFLDQGHGSSLDASGKLSSVSGVEHLDDLSGWHVQELLELNTSVGELSESTGLLLLSQISCVIDVSHSVTETKLRE